MNDNFYYTIGTAAASPQTIYIFYDVIGESPRGADSCEHFIADELARCAVQWYCTHVID